jgi:hypothetical protein
MSAAEGLHESARSLGMPWCGSSRTGQCGSRTLRRAALRQAAKRAPRVGQPAYLFVNNRLEGNAPATIEAVVSAEDA